MNPVTQALLKQIKDDRLNAFVAAWDDLEELFIGVYKAGEAHVEQAAQYARLRDALGERYPPFEAELAPHWRATRIKGQPLDRDPFRALIAPVALDDFIGDWAAMQTLPAARQALNEMLVARLDAGS
jgi:hypothetical protein